jgi:hypothetical protein
VSEATRRLQHRLLEALPGIADRVIQGYQEFTEIQATDKEFAARQSAGKSALGHLDALIKLLRWAEAGVAAELAAEAEAGRSDEAADGAIDAEERQRLNRLLREARGALGRIEAAR